MKFQVSDGTEKRVTLQQAMNDVLVMVEGRAIVALRSQEGVVATRKESCEALGLRYREE